MAYSPSAVANTLFNIAREAKVALDPMKMQKLVYFAHGWHLGLSDGALITEPIEAWDYGPVVASLYRELKPYGAGQILDTIRDFAPKPEGGFALVSPTIDDAKEKAFLVRILQVYGKLSALQLSEMTHRPDTPWSVTRVKFPGRCGSVIPDTLMGSYFKQLAEQNARTAAARA